MYEYGGWGTLTYGRCYGRFPYRRGGQILTGDDHPSLHFTVGRWQLEISKCLDRQVSGSCGDVSAKSL